GGAPGPWRGPDLGRGDLWRGHQRERPARHLLRRERRGGGGRAVSLRPPGTHTAAPGRQRPGAVVFGLPIPPDWHRTFQSGRRYVYCRWQCPELVVVNPLLQRVANRLIRFGNLK